MTNSDDEPTRRIANVSQTLPDRGADTDDGNDNEDALEPMPDFTGTCVAGHLVVKEKLGAGGMSLVYRATDSNLKRDVALKVLHPSLSEDNKYLMRFKQEARAASRLDHPNIIKVLEYGIEKNKHPFLVMDCVYGRSIEEVLKTADRLDVDTTLQILLQVCAALKHAHSNNVVHRDLKPSNVMLVDHEGRQFVKLVDFGIAKVLVDDGATNPNLTRTGEIFGSASYMSPEQGKSGKNVDHRSDIYSLGILTFECLTGKVPFIGESFLHTLMLHQTAIVPSLAQTIPGAKFPPELEHLVQKMLAKQVSGRYQSIADLEADVNSIIAHGTAPVAVETTHIGTKQGTSGNFFIIALIVIVVLVVGIAVAWPVLNHS